MIVVFSIAWNRFPDRRRMMAVLAASVSCVALAALPSCTHTGVTPIARESGAPKPAEVRTPPAEPSQLRASAREAFTVRLQYLQTTQEQIVTTGSELLVSAHDLGLRRLPAGAWRVTAEAKTPARRVYPVYVKSFGHGETAQLRAAMSEWRQRGYEPSVTTLGRAVAGSDGTLHDNRTYWLAVRRCASQPEADAVKKRLASEKVWSWTREEVVEPAQGVATFRSSHDSSVLHAKLPVTLRSEGLITLPDARKGHPPVEVPGPIEVLVDQTGHTAFRGEVSMEEYLRGILPAEMYASWPLEALKAQAVAARSEVIVHASGKHYFDGYDFCIEQHCRAFGGRKLFDSRTDQAVRETAGIVLVQPDESIVPTVFSSNCGGWTESNENVWDGEAEGALRGRPDYEAARYSTNNAERWLSSGGDAYCAGDKDYYRWTRTISLAKLSAQFDRDHGIGTLRGVEELERGVSGRLKSVRLVGSRKSAVIDKELNIRRAFENLPSALCTFSVQGGSVVVKGAGRGHGVGLCQHGAHGMANRNFDYAAILRHYFSGASIGRL